MCLQSGVFNLELYSPFGINLVWRAQEYNYLVFGGLQIQFCILRSPVLMFRLGGSCIDPVWRGNKDAPVY